MLEHRFLPAGVAQLVEHLICNQRVRGSNPFASSRLSRLAGVRLSGSEAGSPLAKFRAFFYEGSPSRAADSEG